MIRCKGRDHFLDLWHDNLLEDLLDLDLRHLLNNLDHPPLHNLLNHFWNKLLPDLGTNGEG